jgi:hypothetical protein
MISNNSNARRDKNEKNKKREDPKPLRKQVPSEAEREFLSLSLCHRCRQPRGRCEVELECRRRSRTKGQLSLSSFSRLSSSAEPKTGARLTRDDSSLSDHGYAPWEDEENSYRDEQIPRILVSPSQFVSSLRRPERRQQSAPMKLQDGQQNSTEDPSSLTTSAQVFEAPGKEDSLDVPVEAVAYVVRAGEDTNQPGNQGHSQGSSSATLPQFSFNMLPPEHMQAVHRNLAAELIHA